MPLVFEATTEPGLRELLDALEELRLMSSRSTTASMTMSQSLSAAGRRRSCPRRRARSRLV
jgi:hypothetical protein